MLELEDLKLQKIDRRDARTLGDWALEENGFRVEMILLFSIIHVYR